MRPPRTSPSRTIRVGGDRRPDRHPSFVHEPPTDPHLDADRRWMEEAIREAAAAGARGEVPSGAVVVLGDRVPARAGDASVAVHDPAAHAEGGAPRAAPPAAPNPPPLENAPSRTR